jgi:tetratricopeptide (TPR) repeat protein
MEGADTPTFGEALASFRTRARLSQQQLAKQLGKNRRSVAAWEGGDYLPKTKGDVLELARILALNDEEATILLKAAGIDPSLAIWNIPFPRNPFFTGRDQELEQLHAQMYYRQTAAVGQAQSISGLGGIGKTQLAVEYAYRHYEEYQYVLWARAESVETLTASFIEIARLLNLPEKDESEQAITIQAVKRWLQQRRGWLLILDSADNPTLFPDFLPPTVGGHLLITTRAADVSAHLAGLAHPLMVNIFSDEQGALFLLHRSGLLALDVTLEQAEPHVRQLARAIVHELGGLPLALDQAGAYLKATGSSLASYQQLYQQRRAQLLAQRRGADHPEPVATTWNISFRNVEQQSPAAADLLRLCAFLHPDAIPEEIVMKGAAYLGPHLSPVAEDPFILDEAIMVLGAYSLIRRDVRDSMLNIHKLVQGVLRDSMNETAQDIWTQRVVRAVHAAFPVVDFTTWSQCEQYLPHALACAALIEQRHLTLSEAASLLSITGEYLHARARYSEAEPLLEQVLAICERQLGAEHAGTVGSLNNLAALYLDQGKYGQAELLFERAVAICGQQFGPEHPDIASSLNGIAATYFSQGKYEQAEPLYERALAMQEQFLGVEHPDTANTLNNLAELYQAQGKYEQVEPLLQKALEVDEKVFGSEHPRVATDLNNLALLYHDQGKYEQAEPLYERALAICEQQLGAEHSDTARALNNLASLYRAQGKYGQAESLFERALAICEQQLGPEHPYTVGSLNNLAAFYSGQGKYEQAASLFERALAIWERQLGPEHPYIASCLDGLGGLYHERGRDEEAELLLQRAFTIRKQMLGLEHPDTAHSFYWLALLYHDQGKYDQAEPLLERALAIREQQLGPEHPLTQATRKNYADLLRAMGRDGEAKQMEEDV